jgi:PHD/YefM family antitoxin component YafN of YafNO toxin-antitoxin module
MEDWSAIQEILYVLAVPGMRESIKAGMAEPLAKSAKRLDW